MIAVINSGSANLGSVLHALVKVGSEAVITDDPMVINSAAGIVFPGVGAFEHAARLLREKKLDTVLADVIAAGKPFLGICLGLQLLFGFSEERSSKDLPFPKGINAVPGRVKRFAPGLTVPHVGWNRVFSRKEHPLLEGLNEGSYFYFNHSYYVEPEEREVVLTETEYGEVFVSSIARGNLMGVQFHPEKSGSSGLRLLKNFAIVAGSAAPLE